MSQRDKIVMATDKSIESDIKSHVPLPKEVKKHLLLKGGIKIMFKFFLAGLLSLVVSFSVLMLSDTSIARMLSQAFCFFLMIVLSFGTVWEEGNADFNKINFDRVIRDEFKGVKYGLIASVPGFIIYFMILFSKLGIINESFFTIGKFLNPIFFSLNLSLFPNTLSLNELPLIGFILIIFEFILPIIICGFAYQFGLRRFSFGNKFLYPIIPKKKNSI